MKKYIPILLILVVLTSCGKEFLDLQPHEFTDAVFWKTADQAEAALAGVYSPLQDEEALGGEDWCGMETFGDNAYMNDNYSDYVAMTEFRATQNTEGDLNGLAFISYYKTIKRAGDVLANVPGMSIDEERKKRILGEANFLQAFSYYELAARYGGLPIYDANNSASSLVRATAEETWNVIEANLVTATSQLSWNHEEGRPGLGATWGFLAKVYAYEKKWTEAKAAAEMVINSGSHTLNPDYAQVFTIENENISEILWGLGARLNEYPITPVLMLPKIVWNGLHPEPNGEGWRLVSATNAFYDAYQSGDLRKAGTVAKRNVDLVTYNGYTDILQAPLNQSEVICIKYMSPYAETYTGWAAGLNVPAFRYSDVLLIDAEAIMMLNGGGPTSRTTSVAAAAVPFNKVRARAGLPEIAAPNFNDLMYERRMELAFEGGDRHFDLVRWGLAAEVYNSLPAEGTYKPVRTFNPAVHNLMPYPQREIDNSGGSITQNPGYTGAR
ncbi:MAG: RagB/SusD family nutrient uptake outer membrane protein [Bacteroidota bacterium]